MAHELDLKSFIARYRIVSRIGSGGIGEVYLAEDATLNRQVAIKGYCIPDLQRTPTKYDGFVQEAKPGNKNLLII